MPHVKFICYLAAICLGLTAHAVTISINGELIKDSEGSAAPQTSLVLFLASTSDSTFNQLFPGSVGVGDLIGDELVIGRFDLSNAGTDGVLFGASTGDVPLSLNENWSADDPIALAWFPNLNSAATSITVSETYGLFTDPSGSFGASWLTPASGDVFLEFDTEDASALFADGNIPADAGIASLNVVPEPSTYAALVGICALGLALYRRRGLQPKA